MTESLLITSHSIDGTFESCPRRFEFRHLYQQVPLSEGMGLAAEIGTALHEAVQEWTRDYDVDKSNLTLLKWWPWRLEDARAESGMRDSSRTLGNSLLLLDAIRADAFWDEWEVATLPDGTPAIELPWRILHKSLGSFPHPISGEPVWLATQGKIDWILRHKVDRHRYRVCDLKTTVMDSVAQEASFRFSGQAGQYGLVLAKAIGLDWQNEGMEVTYFVAEFAEFGLPEVVPRSYFLEPEEVWDSIRTKNERLQRMIAMGIEGFFPRRSHGCTFYQKPCGFLDVCHRRDPAFLSQWFANDQDRFKTESRIYEPYWTLEA